MMIYELGMYRVGPARTDGVFLIPLLTATSRSGLELKLTQYSLTHIPMDPFSLKTALTLRS